jgi:hypothetical protein
MCDATAFADVLRRGDFLCEPVLGAANGFFDGHAVCELRCRRRSQQTTGAAHLNPAQRGAVNSTMFSPSSKMSSALSPRGARLSRVLAARCSVLNALRGFNHSCFVHNFNIA